MYEVKPVLLVLIYVSVLHFLKAVEVMIYFYLLTSVLELEECPLYNGSPLVGVEWGKLGNHVCTLVEVVNAGQPRHGSEGTASTSAPSTLVLNSQRRKCTGCLVKCRNMEYALPGDFHPRRN